MWFKVISTSVANRKKTKGSLEAKLIALHQVVLPLKQIYLCIMKVSGMFQFWFCRVSVVKPTVIICSVLTSLTSNECIF